MSKENPISIDLKFFTILTSIFFSCFVQKCYEFFDCNHRFLIPWSCLSFPIFRSANVVKSTQSEQSGRWKRCFCCYQRFFLSCYTLFVEIRDKKKTIPQISIYVVSFLCNLSLHCVLLYGTLKCIIYYICQLELFSRYTTIT